MILRKRSSALFLFQAIRIILCTSDASFYIRHHSGKCLSFDTTKAAFVFQSICSEKFRWISKARLYHVPTNKCVRSHAPEEGSKIGLSTHCSGVGSILTYDQSSRILKHLRKGYCFQPKSGKTIPDDDETLVFKDSCASNTNRYYFVATAYYVIRHLTTSFCWVYDKINDRIGLRNTSVCDRFEYVNSKHLRHVASGTCAKAKSTGHMSLTSDCSSPGSVINLRSGRDLHVPADGKCIASADGAASPPDGSHIATSACSTAASYKWYFYDDRDILKVKIISESCDDYPAGTDCLIPKGHIIVNGYQYSLNHRGINLVLVDYKSGIIERQALYDIHEYSASRDALAADLNSLQSNKVLLLAAKDSIGINYDLSLALQKVGVSVSFAKVIMPQQRLSLATIAYTGSKRYPWETSIDKVKGEGTSVLEKTIYSFRDFNGIQECYEEMGLRTRKVPDERITAVSIHQGDPAQWKPGYARLHNTAQWCSGSPISDYIQIDLGSIKTITGLATQVHGANTDYLHNIKRFYITYSTDGINWKEYTGYSENRQQLHGNENIKKSVNVNWLARTQLRYFRLVPLTRRTNKDTHCVRLELFGCDLGETVVTDTEFTSKALSVADHSVGKFSIHGYRGNSRTVLIQVSTAENSSSLASYIDQFHFHKVNETSVRQRTGTESRDSANITMLAKNKLALNSGFQLQYSPIPFECYEFAVQIEFWVIDAQLPSGNVWNTYTCETDDAITVYSRPIEIKRQSPDRASIIFKVSETTKEWFQTGDQLLLNTSLVPWLGSSDRSSANAYQLEMRIYYDSQFLELISMNALAAAVNASLPPSYNDSRPGYINLKNDIFGPVNAQVVHFVFRFTIPQHILKGSKCQGDIIFEFKYRTNALKFNGKWNVTLGKILNFKCKVSNLPKSLSVGRLAVPLYSVVYDDTRNFLVVCKKRIFEESAHRLSCYLQNPDNVTWVGLPNIGSVLGFDTENSHLYGTDLRGISYMQSRGSFFQFSHIDDGMWQSISGVSRFRISKKTNSLQSLPVAPGATWRLPTTGEAYIAMTRMGVYRKIRGIWKRVFQF